MELAILLYPGCTALDAIGPYEVFSHLPGVAVHMVGLETGPIRTDSGALGLMVDKTLAEMARPWAFLIPGGLSGTYAVMKNQVILDWIVAAHEGSHFSLSVCTGSLILGAAGILRGLPATSHWLAKDQLSSFGATYQEQRMVRAGKVVTAAGVSAGIDMALQLAEEWRGTKAAQLVQLMLEYDPQPPFDAGSPRRAPTDVVDAAQRLKLT